MYACDICGKEFIKYRSINGHKRLHGPLQGSYRKSRRKRPQECYEFNCLYCGAYKEFDPKSSSGKYCSTACQHQYLWENVRRPKIINGEGGNLRRYLTEEFGYKCSCCNITEWADKEITLQIDHIDGNSDNDNILNIRFLCPNCHSQTETFTGRNTKNTKRNSYLRAYKQRVKT